VRDRGSRMVDEAAIDFSVSTRPNEHVRELMPAHFSSTVRTGRSTFRSRSVIRSK